MQGLPEGSEQPCPSPAPPGFQTHQFPLPFPLNQPAESFINLRKHKSKQKEPKAEPKCDLSNLPLCPARDLTVICQHLLSLLLQGHSRPFRRSGASPQPCSSNDSVISCYLCHFQLCFPPPAER